MLTNSGLRFFITPTINNALSSNKQLHYSTLFVSRGSQINFYCTNLHQRHLNKRNHVLRSYFEVTWIEFFHAAFSILSGTQPLLTPLALVLAVIFFKIHCQWCNTWRSQHTFSVLIVPHWSKTPTETVNFSSVDILKTKLDARWQSLFPEAPL